MTENMKAFMDAIKDNEELKEKFNEISKGGMEGQTSYAKEYTALAKEYGITLTDEDFELDEGELSDEDLGKVSGGFFHVSEASQAMVRAAIDTARRHREELRSQSQGQTQEQTQDQN